MDGEGAIDANAVEVDPHVDLAERVPLVQLDVRLLYARGQVEGNLWEEKSGEYHEWM